METIIIGTLGILLLGLMILCWWQDERIAQLEGYITDMELRARSADQRVRMRLAAEDQPPQTTVEVQDDPADWDICDEHETVFPRHGKCPCCDTVEGE